MEMVSPLPLLLLILTEYCWASPILIPTTHSQLPDTMSVPTSSSGLSSSSFHLPLETASFPASDSDSVLLSSPPLDASPLTLLAKTSDSIPTTVEASSTTLAPTTYELTKVDKENPSSTQELATHTSTLASSTSDVVVTTTTPHPDAVSIGEASITEQENTTQVITKTTSSGVISANTTTLTVTRGSQTTFTTSTSLTNVSPADKLKQEGDNSLVVILVVVILTVTLLVVLFLLWRQRQRRRTGALMLVGSGKHKGAGDAWAGPVQPTEDQAASGSAAVEGETGNLEGEGTGRRPTLTTFFGRRKSRQGSVMLEDLEGGTATNNLKDESEPLVENMDGAVKPPVTDGSNADGSVAGDGNLPSAPVTKV
ncbi:leukosialin [Notamacropus eugenii]|uniref:leukosialin n=1 Tax=Notamacropus eugenii TaxID=9315 RepID=UPI003B66FDC1